MKKQLDRFTLVEALGSGGAGSVYRAEEALPGGVQRAVALKVLPAIAKNDKAGEARFCAEVKAIAALAGHPHIVTFYSVGITDEIPWIAMEYIASNLAAHASEQGAPPAEVARLIEHVARGLDFMHGLTPPLLHNDLKPANILLDPWGNYRITDFGLASLSAADRTHVLATVRYAAPELLSREFGKICPATDLYALGHIAYEMALGGRAYRHQFPAVYADRDSSRDAPPAKWMAWHCSLPTRVLAVAEVRRDFPRPLSDVIVKLMAKPFTDRYAAASDVLHDLQAGTSVPAPPAPGGPHPSLPGMPRGAAAPRPGPAPRGPRPPRTPCPVFPPAAPPARPPPRRPSRKRLRPPETRSPPQPPPPGKPTTYACVAGSADPTTFRPCSGRRSQGLISRLHQVSKDQVTWRSAATVPGLFGSSGTG